MKNIYCSLDKYILAVASTNPVGWTAYIGIVEGRDHDAEAQGVIESGTPLREEIARAMFPEFAKVEYGK
jgi:hypothetical protein